MSIREFTARLFSHGSQFVRHICKRQINTVNITEKINVAQGAGVTPGQIAHTETKVATRSFVLRNVGTQFSLHARRIFIDNVLNRVTNSLSAELRKRAARRIFFGDSGPFFALVGVSLASGTGILTKEEELEGICWEIREAISKIKWNNEDVDIHESQFEEESIKLNSLSLGRPLDKGANAVVYAATIKSEDATEDISSERSDEIIEYPFALKMMFNYDIQSDAATILRAMYRETVPARHYFNKIEISDWDSWSLVQRKSLPPHPNIVAMYYAFADYVQELQDARALYPAALPPRINPEGEGRNMSLFLLMKRYDCSLKQYLLKQNPSLRTRILLFAQLLEGISHLSRYKIAHRDLKSDNLLLDTSEQQVPVLVISDFGCCLADKKVGLMLPYSSREIDKGGNVALMAPEIISQTPGTFSVLNYSKSDLWAAGTIAYEIFGMCNPFYDGPDWKKLKNINYREAQLPDLPEEVPDIIKSLIANILTCNPNRRLDPETCATVCQLFLWAPSSWLKLGNSKLPSSAEILQWLLCLASKVLCEGRINTSSSPIVVENNKCFQTGFQKQNNYKAGRRTYPEYLLISSFLSRVKLSTVKKALNWINTNV